jgi:hypothetical protein
VRIAKTGATPGTSVRPNLLGSWVLLGAVSAALAFSWWEGAQPQGSQNAHVSLIATLAAAALAVLVMAWRRRGTHADPANQLEDLAPGHTRTSVVLGWLVVIGAVVAWDLVSFVVQAHDFPTLSYLFGRVTRFRIGRAGVFLAWLALGGAIGVRRAPARGPSS